ncbi:hypothetical protein K2Z84_27790 [Candidatus Binatia bacterium]|nr:hypothetical protein [Candidatus Binatia bacterium]
MARVQLERPSAAMLVPHDTEDLQSWRAHYPSETWRVSSLETDSEAKARGDARPTRAPWWSPREATIAWPRPVARRRLLIDPEESLIATLLAQGRPTDVTVRIAWQPRPGLLGASRTVVPHLCAFRVGDQALGAGFQQSVEDPTNPAAARLRVSLAGGFSASDLRRLLLCLAWEPSAASAGPDVAATAPQPAGPVTGVAQDGAVDEAYAASVEVLDDFSLVLRAERRDGDGIHLLQEAVAPVSFRSPLHAVLEETVAAMALDVRRSGNALSVYRRYTVQVQPSAPVEDADLATFLRTRPHEKDPYGWGVLQSLGLAAVLRSYDGDGDDFEAPASLHDRLAAASREVLERYAGVHDAQGGSPLLERLGAPFAEVLLRPGSDRSAGSFDALPAASPEEPTLRLDDDGLALLQLSLRPTPADGWSYLGLAMRWRGDPAKPAPTGLALRFQPSTAAVKYDVLYLADGRVLTVDAESGERVVPLAGRRTPHRGPSDRRADRELTVVVRWPAHLAPPELGSTIELVRVAHADGTPVVPPTGVDLRELTDVIHPDGGDNTVFWAIEPDTMPGEFSGAEVFERFPLKSATEWLQPFTGPSAAARAFATFAQLLRRAHPGLAFPTLTGTGSDTAAAAAAAASEETLALYLPWSQRFLDHGRAERDLPPAAPSLALAAPEHQMPWRLAAAADGTLMASFLHADRWGHARAFAVKPVGRYQEIMVGAGALPREESEALLTPDLLLDPSQGSLVKQRLRYEIGYAVAVSPRTERLETPVVLGSVRRRAADRPAPAAGADDVDDAWELVVARHPDESLAFANRPLFARLGWEGIALGFVREYADAAWPRRLRELTGALEVETHPAQAVQLPALPDDRRALGPRALGALAREYPSLWKGADVYRFRSLPYFYRVTALATARAGIVVSPIATVTHEDFPSRLPKRTAPLMLDGDELLEPEMTDEQKDLLRCTTSVGHDDAAATSFLRVGFPLLRYADLLDTATRATWLPDGGPVGGTAPPADDEALDATPNPERNVGWLPDPAVAYVLLRTTRLSDGTALEEEDAEVRLIADEVHPSAGDQPAAPARPVVVRARGTRFAERPPLPALQPGDPGRPRVTMRSIAGRARLFRMEAQLIRRPRASAAALESAALPAAAAGSPEQRLAFNQMAARYAVLSAAHELTIGVALDPGDDDDAVRTKLRTLESDLDARLAKLVARLPVLPSHQARAIDDLRVPLQALLRRLDAAAGGADPRTHAGLPARFVVSWPDATEPPEPLRDLSAPSSFTRAPDDAASYRIALVDLPTDDEIADLLKAFPASAKVGFAALVKRLAKRALLGAAQGFTLRVLRPGNAAVDWPVELPAWADDDEHRDGGASNGTGDTNEGEGAAG